MGDYLIEIGKNRLARSAVKKVGLPLPLPQELERDPGPYRERPLDGRGVVVGHALGKGMAAHLARTLARAGASVSLAGDDQPVETYEEQLEGHGRSLSADPPDDSRPHALLMDATCLRSPADLRAVYDFFAPRIRSVARCGRVVVVARPAGSAASPSEAAAARALDGFVKSVARELGERGATAQLVTVTTGAEGRLEHVVRFVLSARSAYITGQRIEVTGTASSAGDAPLVRPLDGKSALVTGAARGIGACIATAMAREGARVVCMDVPGSDDDLARLASRIGGTVSVGDITDPPSRLRAASLVEERFGGLDVLVHNAGVTRDRTLARMKPERWDTVLGVNLVSLVELDETMRPLLRDGGRIVCTSSVMGLSGNAGQANYAASKAGIMGYVAALAPALAGRGITVNAVAPGFIETKMTERVPVAVREVGRRLSSLAQGGQPEDVAELVTFLATPGASGITGSVVRVCGGMYMGA